MEFPIDHYPHESSTEWWYFWGRVDKKFFFTMANFRSGSRNMTNRATHWSIHDKESLYFEELADDFDQLRNTSYYIAKQNRLSLCCRNFDMTGSIIMHPIIHEGHVRNYYSIPSIYMEGTQKPGQKFITDVWMDHEWGSYRTLKEWDWISIKLFCGLNMLIANGEGQKASMIESNNKKLSAIADIDGENILSQGLGMKLTMKPIVEEKRFNPKLKPSIFYSEHPFIVESQGKEVGYGMRERIYKNG
jgi:predicted secreted hydrolase